MSSIIKNFDFFGFGMNLWSGKSSLDFGKDLSLDADGVLIGQKQICPPALLRPFTSLNKRVFTNLDRIGSRLNEEYGRNIWLIPVSCSTEAEKLIKEAHRQFGEHVEHFKREYDAACDEFFAGKKYAHQLSKAKLPLAVAVRKFGFGYDIFQMGNRTTLKDADLFSSFARSVSSQAKDLLDSWLSRDNQTELKSASVNALHALHDKCTGFRVVSSQAAALAEYIGQKLMAIPKGNPVSDMHLVAEAYSILELLQDPEKVMNFTGHLQQRLLVEPISAQTVKPVLVSVEMEDEDIPDELLPSLEPIVHAGVLPGLPLAGDFPISKPTF